MPWARKLTDCQEKAFEFCDRLNSARLLFWPRIRLLWIQADYISVIQTDRELQLFRIPKVTTILAIALLIPMLSTVPAPAEAQSYRDYCHDRAKRLSGYRGRPKSVAGGAVQGAIGGAILSGILGGNKRDRKRAVGIGALLGGMSAANRPNSRAARIYRLEYDECRRRR